MPPHLALYDIKCVCFDSIILVEAFSYLLKHIIYNFRPDAAKSMKALFKMTGLESWSTVYKELRPQQILKSEENVQRVRNAIANEYLNSLVLKDECEKRKLLHLSSDVWLTDEIADEI